MMTQELSLTDNYIVAIKTSFFRDVKKFALDSNLEKQQQNNELVNYLALVLTFQRHNIDF